MSERVPESADRRIAEVKRAVEKYLRIAQEMAQREAEREAEKKRAEAEAKKAAASAERKAERAARKRAAEVEATQAETETESGAGGGTCYRCWQNGIPCVRLSDPGRQKACTPCAVAKAKCAMPTAKCAMPTAEELVRGRPKEGVKTSSCHKFPSKRPSQRFPVESTSRVHHVLVTYHAYKVTSRKPHGYLISISSYQGIT